MKNITLLLLAIFSIFSINSCREDGDWSGDQSSRYGFKVERDKEFIEKAINEQNQLKFNVVATYNFEAVPMKFKYSANLKGVLKLNNVVLEQNKEYTLENANNIFEYVGEIAGLHNLKFSLKNEKGATLDEEFSLPYSVSDFAHTHQGGESEIFQGEDTKYLMKITPAEGKPNTGYEIKFNSYSGVVKLNDATISLGQYYPLTNIENFYITLNTNIAGGGALHYTIKNSTVSKEYSIQQEITKRKIIVESMNISQNNVSPNTAMSLIGVVKKTPFIGDMNIKYKTWITAASNNNTNGIQNTNNVYMPYTSQTTGSFTYNFNALEVGEYTYNIQFQDEFGNESEVKAYTIKVENNLSFEIPPTAHIFFKRDRLNYTSAGYPIVHYFKGSGLNTKVKASTGNGIARVKFELSFTYNGQNIQKVYEYPYNDFPENVNVQVANTNDEYKLGASFESNHNNYKIDIQNAKFKCFAYDKYNNMIQQEGDINVSIDGN